MFDIYNSEVEMFILLVETLIKISSPGGSGDEPSYVDLKLNPERYTGYAGHSTKRIWGAIYHENCFRWASVAMVTFIIALFRQVKEVALPLAFLHAI